MIFMKEFPPVTIVISTHNRASILKKCLDSVFRLEYPKYEIIIINDGSNDNTSKVLKKYKNIKTINFKEPIGPVSAKNVGIKKAKYDYIGLLDDDIILSKLWLKKLVNPLIKGNADIATSAFAIPHSSCIKKIVFETVGLFDENFQIGKNRMAYRDDNDFECRVRDTCFKIEYIPSAKFSHIHPKLTSNKQKFNYIIKILKLHQLDPLLFKKHPDYSKSFFRTWHGFVSIKLDFNKVTGRYKKPTKLSFSELFGNDTLYKKIFVCILGIFYVIAVRIIRIKGSINYKTFLI